MNIDLLEIITKNLGSGIGKALVALWAKDSIDEKSYSLIGGSIVDALKDVIPNYVQRTKIKRQIEEISEKICEKVYDVLADCEGVEDAQKAQIALIVIDAFEFDLPSGREMAKLNLDPSKLGAHYLEKIDFSNCRDAEKELIERIISECAQYLTDISAVLPKVGEEAVLQSLRNDRILLEKAEEIFQEVKRIRQESITKQKAPRPRKTSAGCLEWNGTRSVS